MTHFIADINAAIAAELIATALPSPTEPVVAIRLADGWECRWLPPTFSPGEYASFTLRDAAPAMGWTQGVALAVNGITALTEGNPVTLSDGAVTDYSVFEPVVGGGKLGSYPRNFIGLQHGFLQPVGANNAGAYMNGVGPGQMGVAVGTVLRGFSFLVESNYTTLFPFTAESGPLGTYGTLTINHGFSRNGLNVIGIRTVTDPAFVSDAAYSFGCPLMNIDSVTISGTTSLLAKNTGTGSIDGPNLGQVPAFTFFNSARPSLHLDVSLPWGTPGLPALGWTEAVNEQAFIQRRDAASNYVNKLYVFERSKPTETPLASGETFQTYQLTKVP